MGRSAARNVAPLVVQGAACCSQLLEGGPRIHVSGAVREYNLALALAAVVQRKRTKLRGRELSPGLLHDRQKY